MLNNHTNKSVRLPNLPKDSDLTDRMLHRLTPTNENGVGNHPTSEGDDLKFREVLFMKNLTTRIDTLTSIPGAKY